MTDEDERDPFGRLAESVDDREGDPFESLDAPADANAESEAEGSPVDDATTGADATEPVPDEGQTGDLGGQRVEPGTPELGVDDAEAADDDPFTSPESSLSHVDVGDVDEDEIWSAIADAQSRGSVAEAGERTYAEVSKHSFCETCRYFSGPPDIACGHDGTEIMEFVDMETVRLVDCPVVAERRDLQRGEQGGR